MYVVTDVVIVAHSVTGDCKMNIVTTVMNVCCHRCGDCDTQCDWRL